MLLEAEPVYFSFKLSDAFLGLLQFNSGYRYKNGFINVVHRQPLSQQDRNKMNTANAK